MTTLFRLLARAMLAALLLIATCAHANAWPEKRITLVVPFPPGGNTDTLARLVAAHLGQKLGQTVIVENKPGAGSMLGSDQVARSAPDGYTFLVGSIANSLNHFFYKKPLYDMNKDLVAVSHLVNVPNYLAVGPSEKLRTIKDIVAYAKANPRKLSCATTGVGTSTYLSCELLKAMTGVDIVNVPYKGGAAAMQDVMGGQANMVIANEALPFINNQRLVGVGVTTGQRSPLAPDLPAISETVSGFDVTSWYGVFAPAGTPQPIIERMAAEISAMLKEEAVQARLKTLGATPVGGTPKEFGNYVNAEMVKWGRVIKTLNIQLD